MKMLTITFKCGWPGCGTVLAEGDPDMKTEPLTYGGSSREVDMCAKHKEALDEILLPLMEDGRAIEVKKTPAKKRSASAAPSPASDPDGTHANKVTITCQVPECGRPIVGKVGMAQHVRRGHHMASLDEYEAQYGAIET